MFVGYAREGVGCRRTGRLRRFYDVDDLHNNEDLTGEEMHEVGRGSRQSQG